jgi:hypothetical protein
LPAFRFAIYFGIRAPQAASPEFEADPFSPRGQITDKPNPGYLAQKPIIPALEEHKRDRHLVLQGQSATTGKGIAA